jgi:hypothetical protein
MSINYQEYELNEYNEKPWYDREIDLFKTIIDKIPAAAVNNFDYLSKYTDLEEAISVIGGNEISLIIDKETTIVNNLTIPENIDLCNFYMGSIITINEGIRLVINKMSARPNFMIFSCAIGDQPAIKIPEIYPEWYGAVNDTATDSSAAIQKALDSFYFNGSTICYGGEVPLYYKYGVKNQIKIRQSGIKLTSKMYSLSGNIEGCAELVAMADFAGNRTICFSGDTYTAGSISVTINGTTVTQNYDTDKHTTLTALAGKVALITGVYSLIDKGIDYYQTEMHCFELEPERDIVLDITIDTNDITGDMYGYVSDTSYMVKMEASSILYLRDNQQIENIRFNANKICSYCVYYESTGVHGEPIEARANKYGIIKNCTFWLYNFIGLIVGEYSEDDTPYNGSVSMCSISNCMFSGWGEGFWDIYVNSQNCALVKFDDIICTSANRAGHNIYNVSGKTVFTNLITSGSFTSSIYCYELVSVFGWKSDCSILYYAQDIDDTIYNLHAVTISDVDHNLPTNYSHYEVISFEGKLDSINLSNIRISGSINFGNTNSRLVNASNIYFYLVDDLS